MNICHFRVGDREIITFCSDWMMTDAAACYRLDSAVTSNAQVNVRWREYVVWQFLVI